MQTLAIIPARGGSKGIPHKNIQLLCGKPLIAWNIEAARASAHIQRVVVSTDDAAIARTSAQYGAEVVWRPPDISGDTATSESALLHVLHYLQEAEDYKPELLVFLQCTSPLTTTEDIDHCIHTLLEQQADTATTVTDFHYFLWRNTLQGADGINHDKRVRPRRQDREQQLLETGAIYVLKTDGFLAQKHRFFGKTALAEMPRDRVLEIDEPVDLLVGEVRLRQLLNKRLQNLLPENPQAVVFDFDGVMTNNRVIVNELEQEAVVCDRGDGMGIDYLKRQDIRLAVISTERNPVVKARCQKLGIECYHNLGYSKHEALLHWCAKNSIDLATLVYMGNDVNDLECMKLAGCAVVPADAHPSILPAAHIVLQRNGGEGAVRQLCDLILSKITGNYLDGRV